MLKPTSRPSVKAKIKHLFEQPNTSLSPTYTTSVPSRVPSQGLVPTLLLSSNQALKPFSSKNEESSLSLTPTGNQDGPARTSDTGIEELLIMIIAITFLVCICVPFFILLMGCYIRARARSVNENIQVDGLESIHDVIQDDNQGIDDAGKDRVINVKDTEPDI